MGSLSLLRLSPADHWQVSTHDLPIQQRAKSSGPHDPGNDTVHKNGPRGGEVTLTRELRFLPSNWDFALDVVGLRIVTCLAFVLEGE
jgi:hypothetical protein